MLNFLALGLAWSAFYVMAYSYSKPSLSNALTFLPATFFRLSLPFIFSLLSAHFSRDLPLVLQLLNPTLTFSTYIFTHRLIHMKDSRLQTFLTNLISGNSSFLKNYDLIAFYSALLLSILLRA